MGFSYFVLEVSLRITEMFIHVKTSGSSILERISYKFLSQNLVTEAHISGGEVSDDQLL